MDLSLKNLDRGQPAPRRRRPFQKATGNARERETPLLKKVAYHRFPKKTMPTPQSPARKKATATRAHHQRPAKIEIRFLQSPEQFDRAVETFTRLAAVPELAGRVPRLHIRNRDELMIQLKQPDYGLWKIIDRVHPHGDPLSPLLYPRDIRQIRRALLDDISILCDLQIAWSADLGRLRIAHWRKPVAAYEPFLDTFDLDIPNIHRDWNKVKEVTVQTVKKQFDVLELLTKLSSSSPDSQRQQRRQEDYTDLDLDPDAVAHVLETNPPPGNIGNLVIRLTKRYTPALSRFIIWYTKRHLHNLPPRTRPPNPSRRDMTMKYCDMIGHLLRLVAEVERHSQQNVCPLVDRAVLRVLYAVLLLQLHANVIASYGSEDLLQLDCPDDSAEAYTSFENFESVAQARREASEAVRNLRAAGGKLDRSTCRLLRGEPYDHDLYAS
ncbi:hypothetical protein DL768_001106 [Monosporascus sp. mg162]|nr:hypothetical protein DL768_001106 [Monosporascus sp. mg162]